MTMTRLSKTTRMRVGLLLALLIGTLGIHWKDILPASEPDPDEIHVLQQGGKVGKLSLEVKEAGSHLHMPARLTFTYDDGREELPTVGRFQHFLVTASGRDLKTLPVGEYQVYVSRGTEYSLDRQKVKIEEGKTAYLSSTLERIVDTTGFISADFHLHLQYAMRDGAMTSAAEGIDLLTATDHNILKDYSPHIRALKLERFITSTVGSEIDTAFGHFNSFPLEIDRWGRREFRHGIRTPGEFLRIVRQEPGEQIVQINHPRRQTSSPGSGYFDERLNADTGAFDYPYFETGFDSFEIFNAITDKSETIHRPHPAGGSETAGLVPAAEPRGADGRRGQYRCPRLSRRLPRLSPQLRGFRNRQPLGDRSPQGRPGRQEAGRHRQPGALSSTSPATALRWDR